RRLGSGAMMAVPSRGSFAMWFYLAIPVENLGSTTTTPRNRRIRSSDECSRSTRRPRTLVGPADAGADPRTGPAMAGRAPPGRRYEHGYGPDPARAGGPVDQCPWTQTQIRQGDPHGAPAGPFRGWPCSPAEKGSVVAGL